MISPFNQTIDENRDISAIAKLFSSQPQASVAAPQTMQQPSPESQIAGAGISAGINLLGGLLGSAAQQAAQQKNLEFESAQQATTDQASALIKAQQAQSDALGRLMQNYKQSLIK